MIDLETRALAYRKRRFRQTPEHRLQSIQEAATFIDDMGLCLFQTNHGIELPSLWGAVAGTSAPAPRWGQHDDVYELAWNWKDRLFAGGHFYYGKALGNYRLFVSTDMLPYLWALSELNYGGEPDDYLELYQDGKLSVDAKNIYRVLREHGPASTTVLRRASGIASGDDAWSRFERALTELQRGLLVAATGIARDNAWKYTFRYATLLDAFPKEVADAMRFSSRQALAHVLAHYVGLVGTATPRQASRLFGWREEPCLRAARDLIADGTLAGKADTTADLLISPGLLETIARGV
ncbi:MAG: AlkZ-related protein [Chloroflexota bacterium]